jgi:hypothetical protein
MAQFSRRASLERVLREGQTFLDVSCVPCATGGAELLCVATMQCNRTVMRCLFRLGWRGRSAKTAVVHSNAVVYASVDGSTVKIDLPPNVTLQ